MGKVGFLLPNPFMTDKNFPEVIRKIHDQDNRFGKGAYYFIRGA